MTQMPDLYKMKPEALYDLSMRAFPHTYAEYVTYNRETKESEWKGARHLNYISKRVALGVARGNARIIVNMPPGRGKSKLISQWVPTWFLEHHPKERVMVCSYGSDLAEFWGRLTRDEINKNPNIRVKLRDDSQSVHQWMTKEGGGMRCDGVGGSILGFRFSLGVIDDPIKDHQDAHSPVVRETLRNWFEHTFMTRQEPNASVVILMHRWHVDDLCGWLIQNHPDAWEVLKFPEIAMENDILGRKPGEPLWPERWSLESSTEARKSMAWNSMYQQNPQSELGDRVYDHFIQDKNVSQMPVELMMGRDHALGLTLDFNVNPGMHGHAVQYDSRQDMVRVPHEFHGERWRTEHLMKDFIAWCICHGHVKGRPETFPWKVLNVYGDRSGRSQNTVTADTDYILIMKMLNEAGIPFNICVPAANPPVNDRVITMNEALCDGAGVVHVQIDKQCTRLLVDLNTQPRDADGQPDKSDRLLGHAADDLGYFVYWVRPAYRHEWKPQKVVGG